MSLVSRKYEKGRLVTRFCGVRVWRSAKDPDLSEQSQLLRRELLMMADVANIPPARGFARDQSFLAYAVVLPFPILRIEPSSSIAFSVSSTIDMLMSGHLRRMSFLVTLPSVDENTARILSALPILALITPSTLDSSSRYAFKTMPSMYATNGFASFAFSCHRSELVRNAS